MDWWVDVLLTSIGEQGVTRIRSVVVGQLLLRKLGGHVVETIHRVSHRSNLVQRVTAISKRTHFVGFIEGLRSYHLRHPIKHRTAELRVGQILVQSERKLYRPPLSTYTSDATLKLIIAVSPTREWRKATLIYGRNTTTQWLFTSLIILHA